MESAVKAVKLGAYGYLSKPFDTGEVLAHLDRILELQGLRLENEALRLQEGEFEPVGPTQTQQVDVRLITATHQDLEARMAEGTFREDLYYRINALTIEIPPLRERMSDLPLLCAFFVNRYNGVLGRRVEGFTSGPCSVWRNTTGPAMCANWKTRSCGR